MRSPTVPIRVRDRYAEIVYRFFYGTARELDLALGDPHPGNYLLCDDGRVAFLDFGMLRELPRRYLDREAVIFAAIRNADAAKLVEAMKALGYLSEDTDWDGPLILEHMRAISWWLQSDEPDSPRARGHLAGQRAPAFRARRAADGAGAANDDAARGAAPAANGGPAVPGRLDAPRPRPVGRPAA